MLLIATGIALLWGVALAHGKSGIILDFRMAYLGGRCVVQHCDPYNEAAMTRIYLSEGGERVPVSPTGESPHFLAAFHVYPPSAEPLFALFAHLPWTTAYALW